MICATCHGRTVMHRCGKREKPVDFEALARAEKKRNSTCAVSAATLTFIDSINKHDDNSF